MVNFSRSKALKHARFKSSYLTNYEIVFSDLNQGWNEDQLQYPCEYCEKVFRNKRSYYNHVNKHKGKTYCHLCSKTLSTVSNLKAHLSQVHQQEMIQD